MSHAVPPAFLFRWAFPVPQCLDLSGERIANLMGNSAQRLPDLSELTGQKSFAEVSCGWNPQGFGVAASVRGKSGEYKFDPLRALDSDGLQVWIDTRCTQNVHRATRFCHHFCILPGNGHAKTSRPLVMQVPLAQAREASKGDTTAAISVAARFVEGGYDLAAWFPAGALTGYEPLNHPRLGFYAAVKDAELGEQPLIVGREFPFDFDPSLWQTLELVS